MQDKLTSKILEFLSVEASKAGTKAKLRCVVDPVLLCFAQAARPYVIAVLVLLSILIGCQGIMYYKIMTLQRSLRG
jgi:hypothetical protein